MKRYTVGIDLGTSNTVVAYVEAGSDAIRVFDVEQLVGPGAVAAQPLLPSVRYHPAAGELPADAIALPWTAGNAADAVPAVIGRYARTLGAQVPGRLVSSAKSWLSNAAVDRLAAILPWGAPTASPRCRRSMRARATSRTCARPGTRTSPMRRSRSRTSF
jgi:molecular chaperone DnaK (HSP70)